MRRDNLRSRQCRAHPYSWPCRCTPARRCIRRGDRRIFRARNRYMDSSGTADSRPPCPRRRRRRMRSSSARARMSPRRSRSRCCLVSELEQANTASNTTKYLKAVTCLFASHVTILQSLCVSRRLSLQRHPRLGLNAEQTAADGWIGVDDRFGARLVRGGDDVAAVAVVHGPPAMSVPSPKSPPT